MSIFMLILSIVTAIPQLIELFNLIMSKIRGLPTFALRQTAYRELRKTCRAHGRFRFAKGRTKVVATDLRGEALEAALVAFHARLSAA